VPKKTAVRGKTSQSFSQKLYEAAARDQNATGKKKKNQE